MVMNNLHIYTDLYQHIKYGTNIIQMLDISKTCIIKCPCHDPQLHVQSQYNELTSIKWNIKNMVNLGSNSNNIIWNIMVKHNDVHRNVFQGGGGGGGGYHCMHAMNYAAPDRKKLMSGGGGGGGGSGLRHFCFPFSKFWVNFPDTE